ncbi:MAG: glycine dehydrogenase [Kiritimatiellia bacterium]|jgi:glycine dehydrogenase
MTDVYPIASQTLQQLSHEEEFIGRHIGPNQVQTQSMLDSLGVDNLEQLMEQVVPASILKTSPLDLAPPCSEAASLQQLQSYADKNIIAKSYVGMGYHDTITPTVILRNVLENPGWYTAYTPYQPEIAQGRLEGLLHFQQMIIDLTGMDMANASMLDEGTAAAEAMAMSKRQQKRNKSEQFIVDKNTHPQSLAIIKTRAEHFGFNVLVGDVDELLQTEACFGVLLQYPGSNGEVKDLSATIALAHEKQALVTVAADIMSLVLLNSPGSMGADIVVGSSQRFGVPMGFGGPHAAFFAFAEKFKRSAPGRIIGVSIDNKGNTALRMAMQTREQHIRREKANSNICTSQVLLALISVFYAIYHGPTGVKRIANRIHRLTGVLAKGLEEKGLKRINDQYFDTLSIDAGERGDAIFQQAQAQNINLRFDDNLLGISINETTTADDISELLSLFSVDTFAIDTTVDQLDNKIINTHHGIPANLLRNDNILSHSSFSQFHSETEMLRYLHRLEAKDIALNHAMIALGSCTMKLNATSEMIPVTWPEFSRIHPFAPAQQTLGYQEMLVELERMLAVCTGYDRVSLQPNAGSQGEYAGLIAIKKYFASKQESHRHICLIPASAHGTNPASAQMAGLDVVVTSCDEKGNVDLADLQQKIDELGEQIACIMVTYPSTHGVFEEGITQLCEMVHSIGAQVYIDGANMNALVGVAAPGNFGGDVSHLNLHKTFCIPHGGGGPGMGPIGVKHHLAPFLPAHPVREVPNTLLENGTISAAPWGSASILPISWMYIKMMGDKGMRRATEIAILNANYMAKKLSQHYPILYTGANGFVAHECLLDLRPLKASSGITEEDIAKRLMDFGFHAPTMSFPVAGTLMIEPTESESQIELDRFCEAMQIIREEIAQVDNGYYPADNNPLVNAPHTQVDLLSEQWDRPYSRTTASHPAPWLAQHKVWPSVNRIDNVYGDRNLICSCAPIESYQ